MNLKQELRVNIERLNVHKCDKCPRVFTSLGLIKHMAYHDNWLLSHIVSAKVVLERIKIFECESCIQSFTSKREYMFHKLKHIQNNVRDDRLEKKSQLLNSDINKPYSCPDCDYKFVTKGALEEHSILHQPFPHICDCGIGYYKQRDLLLHKKLVHKTELETVKHNTNSIPKVSKHNNINGQTLKSDLIKKKKLKKNTGKRKIKSENGKLEDKKPKVRKYIYPDIEIKQLDKNIFECPLCKKHLSSKKNVYVHYRVHSGERPYSCDQCGKAFTQSAALRRHKYVHKTEDQENFQCAYCEKVFNCPENRNRHELIHGTKKFLCTVCEKAFHDPSALVRHNRIHTGDKRYKCPYCPMAFTDVSGYKPHILRHKNIRDFSCDICQLKFITRGDLKLHSQIHDLNRELKFCCDYCKKRCSTKHNLQTHIIKLHLFLKHKCVICYKKCNSLKELNKHYKTHNCLLFECNDCSRVFRTKDNLARHFMRRHMRIQCDKCLKLFRCQSDLKRHQEKEGGKCMYV